MTISRAISGPLAFSLAALFSGPALAQSGDPYPSVEEIRDEYERRAAAWPEAIPEVLNQALRSAEDSRHGETLVSKITLPVARDLVGERVDQAVLLAFAARVAVALDAREIELVMLHGAFYGQRCQGVGPAAEAYFGKNVHALELHEIAYLVGLLKAPLVYHPGDPERAVSRRNFVLNAMLVDGVLTEAEAETARAMPLGVRDPLGSCQSRD